MTICHPVSDFLYELIRTATGKGTAALEITMHGTQGIAPDKQGFKLHHAPGKTFGASTCSLGTMSWKLAIPEMVENLQLPYGKEYGMAVQLNSATPSA